jgi:hypothetical protein
MKIIMTKIMMLKLNIPLFIEVEDQIPVETRPTSFNENEDLTCSENNQDKNIFNLFSNYKDKAMKLSADNLLDRNSFTRTVIIYEYPLSDTKLTQSSPFGGFI